jgi:uncharacterized BrkB/YihY/UPF0761 family membrane protein
MTEPEKTMQTEVDPIRAAYREGHRRGLAVAALAASLVAFVSLLGVEKAILAVVLGALSLRGARAGWRGRSFGVAAVVIASVYIVAFVIFLALYYDKVRDLIQQLQKLG